MTLLDPYAAACPDCSAQSNEPCIADERRTGIVCLGRAHAAALGSFNSVQGYEIADARVWFYRPRVSRNVVRRAQGPRGSVRCSRCSQLGHNQRNPKCPGREVQL